MMVRKRIQNPMATKPNNGLRKCLKCDRDFQGNGFHLCKKCRKENEESWDLESRYVSHIREAVKARGVRLWAEMGWSVHRTID